MAYNLTWGGKLWTVTVPDDVGEAKWPYVQAFVATGGNHSKAMMRVLAIKYPGLGYGAINLQPVSFASLSVSHAAAPYASASGRSAPFSQTHKGSQRPTHRGAGPVKKDGESGISDLCKPAPRPATSNASRPLFRSAGVAPVSEKLSKQHAKQNTEGWMGSKSTNA